MPAANPFSKSVHTAGPQTSSLIYCSIKFKDVLRHSDRQIMIAAGNVFNRHIIYVILVTTLVLELEYFMWSIPQTDLSWGVLFYSHQGSSFFKAIKMSCLYDRFAPVQTTLTWYLPNANRNA